MDARALLAIVVLALAAAGSATAAATRPPLVMQADVRVAGFRTHEHLGDALRVFGTPGSLRALPGFRRVCVATWPRIGLTMRFFAAGCAARAVFVRATATGGRWQTIRRLRIGDPVARLQALYLGVTSRRAARGDLRWPLFRRGNSSAGLTAVTRQGRVVELVVAAHVFTVRFGG